MNDGNDYYEDAELEVMRATGLDRAAAAQVLREANGGWVCGPRGEAVTPRYDGAMVRHAISAYKRQATDLAAMRAAIAKARGEG